MNCELYYSLLSGHIDGVNTEEEEAKLQEHLAVCPACRTLLQELEQTDALLAQTPAPPADLTARIMKQIPKKRRRRGLLYFAAPAATLATAAVLALAVFGAWNLPVFARADPRSFSNDVAMMENASIGAGDSESADDAWFFSRSDAPGDEKTNAPLEVCSAAPNNAMDTEAFSASPVMIVWYPEEQSPFADLSPVLSLPLNGESDAILLGTLAELLPQASEVAESLSETLCSVASNITLYTPSYAEMTELLDLCTGEYRVALYYPAEMPDASEPFLLLAVAMP